MENNLLEFLNNSMEQAKREKEDLKQLVSEAKKENLEIEEETLKQLFKDKAQLEEALENEKQENIIKEYQNDLEKVNNEIENWKENKKAEIKNKDTEIRRYNRELKVLEEYNIEKAIYEEATKQIKEQKENLEKNKNQAETELNRLTDDGNKTFIGEKPIEVRECEEDLKNIEEKLNQLTSEEEKAIEKFTKIEKKFKRLCEKYEIKENIENEIQEDIENEEIKEDDEELTEEDEEIKEDEEELTEENEEINNEYEDIPLEDLLNQQEKEEEKNTELPKEETIANAEPENIAVNNEKTEKNKNANKKTEETQQKIKIILGNNGIFQYYGKDYKIDFKTIKNGLLLNSSKESIYEEETGFLRKYFSPEISEIINNFNKKTESKAPIDYSVLLSIGNSVIPEEEKADLIKSYLKNAYISLKQSMKEDVEDKWQNNLEIIYDMKNLSKISLFKTLFSKKPLNENLSLEEKAMFKNEANKAARFGMGKTIGKFKKGVKAKILEIFGIKLLPEPSTMHTIDMKDDKTNANTTEFEQEAAEYYDKYNWQNKKLFKSEIEFRTEAEEITPEVKKEINELYDSQKEQEEKELGDE